jgi:hypothetical protein
MAQRRAPYRVETVRGTPIHVSGRTLVPVARVVSATSHHATIRRQTVEARGAGVVRVRPLHLVQVWEGDHGVLPVPDVTARTIAAMLLAGLAIALVSLVLIVANRLTAPSR